MSKQYSDLPQGFKVFSDIPEGFSIIQNSDKKGPDERTASQVAMDQAMNVLKGVPQAVTGIPGAMKDMLGLSLPALAYDAATGNLKNKASQVQQAFTGMTQPFVQLGRGVGELLAPNTQPKAVPESPEFEQQAQAAGALAGSVAIPKLASALKGAVVNSTAPERLYESALKPGPRSNTRAEINRMVATGLNQEIPVTSGGSSRLNDLVQDLNSQITAKINTASPQVTVNKFKVASKLSDLANRLANQVNPEADLRTVAQSGNEFLRNQPADIPANMAQAIKKGTYQALSDKSFGELKGASIESQKALARGLKEELARQIPEIQALNLTESDLLDLRPELESALNRIQNKELFGIGTPIMGGAASAATGSPLVGILSGLTRSVLDRPGVKSRLAIALAKARP